MSPPAICPPAALLAWVVSTLGHDARVVNASRISGGLTSIVHLVAVERNGRVEEYVLPWWTPDWEWKGRADRAVPQGAAVLGKLEGSDIPAPRGVGSTWMLPLLVLPS